MHRIVIALALLALAATQVVVAAVTISGSVLDETGVPVAGARVLAGTAAATTDAAGIFRIEVPDTGDYDLRVEREGFFLLTEKAVHFDPGTPLDVRITHQKELAETMDVPYSPPVVDPDQTAEVKRLDGQAILNLPYAASQDYRQALPLMPGTIQDNGGQVHFNGGDVNETSYRLDGFDMANIANGGLTERISVDTVQEVEWSANRMPAEDKGSAGTVDVQTEMGDDRWRFGITNPIPSISNNGGLHFNHWSPRLMTSGPIKKGKLWFHTAFDPFYTVSTITGLPNGQNRTSSFSGSDLTRFQWNATNWQTLTGSVLYNRADAWNNGLSILTPQPTTTNQRSALLMGTIKDQFIVGGNLVEAGFADTESYMRTSPLGSVPYEITPFGSAGNYFRDQSIGMSRQEGLVDTVFRPWHSKGTTHQFRVGTNVESSNLHEMNVRHDESVVRADDSLVRSIAFEGSPFEVANDSEFYAYASDHWSPAPASGLTFDIGVRTQWSRITGANPPAPRFGAAWAPKHSGNLKLSAGWGIYYDPVTLSLLAMQNEQVSLTSFYSPDDMPLGPPIESTYVVNPKALRSPKYTVASVSAEKPLLWNVFGRVSLTERDGNRGFMFNQNLLDTTNEYIANNGRSTRYRSAEFALRRTFLSKYQWFASYTRSDATSNAIVQYTIENPILSPQEGGPQPWNAPNRILMWGWAPVEKTWFPALLRPIVGVTDIQVLAEYHSGFPFTAVTETGYLAGTANSWHYPDYMSLNLALERQFHFRGYLWALRGGVVNVLDRANPNVVNNDFDSPQFLLFGRGQARAFNVRLRFLGKK